jgi:hypothetical protein
MRWRATAVAFVLLILRVAQVVMRHYCLRGVRLQVEGGSGYERACVFAPGGLMGGRPKTPTYSWVVAATGGTGSPRGLPTGYSVNQVHPECYRQFCEGEDNIIDSADVLREWLRRK